MKLLLLVVKLLEFHISTISFEILLLWSLLFEFDLSLTIEKRKPQRYDSYIPKNPKPKGWESLELSLVFNPVPSQLSFRNTFYIVIINLALLCSFHHNCKTNWARKFLKRFKFASKPDHSGLSSSICLEVTIEQI